MTADADKCIGAVARALRGDMAQEALATAMRHRGWKWSQATVWSVERGDRPLRLAEAADLATILRVTIDDLLSGDESTALRVALTRATSEVSRAREALHAAEAKVAAISRELHE